jgi:aldose sugar dehydrogenase
MNTKLTRPASLALVAILAASCSAASSSGTNQAAGEAPAATALKVEEVATGLEYPWGVAFLPDGAMLVTEREGGLKLVKAGQPIAPVAGLPAAYVDNQAGVFDVALHPGFAENKFVYVSLATGTKAANRTTIVRGRFDGTNLVDVTPIFNAGPDKRGGAHFGGRMLFQPDGTLLLTLGDGYTEKDRAQTLDNDFGKIVRLTDTGQPAPGNPFAGQAGARPEIWSYGHRNVQGLTHDPATGTVYAHEHGPKGGDEVNAIRPGVNYGWPKITYGVDYSGAPISAISAAPGMEQPLVYWVPSIAPSGMTFYTGEMFPAWKGDLLVSALAGTQLRRVDLDNGSVKGQEVMLKDREQRLRHVAQAPDGALILLTDEPDGKVLRVTPAP